MDKELIAGLSNLSESLDRIAEVLSKKEEPKSATAMALKMGEFDKQIKEISVSITEIKKDNQKILDQQDTILKILKKRENKTKEQEKKDSKVKDLPSEPTTVKVSRDKSKEREDRDKEDKKIKKTSDKTTEEIGKEKKQEQDSKKKGLLGGFDTKKIKDGIGIILAIAVGVIAIGLALKIVGKLDFVSVMALALALPLIAIAFAKIAAVFSGQEVEDRGKKVRYPKFNVRDLPSMMLTMVGFSTAIMVSSFMLSKVKPIGIFQAMTSILIAGTFAVLAPNLGKLINAFNKVNLWGALRSVVLLPIVLLGISTAIMLSSYVLSKVKPIGFFQAITAILIAGTFAAVSYGLGKLLSAFKGINPMTALLASALMPIVLVAVSISIAVSSWFLSKVKPIGFFQALTAIMIGATFSVIAFGIGKIISAFKGVNPAAALMASLVMPVLFVALSISIMVSSWFLSKVRPIGLFQALTAIFISAVFVVLSFGVAKILKAFRGINPATAALAAVAMPVIFTALSIAIMASSFFLSKVKVMGFFQFLTSVGISLLFVVFAYSVKLVVSAIKNINPKDVVKAALIMVGWATTVAIAGYIISKMPDISIGKIVKFTLFSIALVFTTVVVAFAIKALSKINLGDIIKGGLVIVAIAVVIALTSRILNFGKYDKYPSLKWALGVGLTMVAFGIAALVLGTIITATAGLGAVAIAAGLLAIIAIAGAIVATDKIISTGSYSKYPGIKWALGVGSTLVGFAAAVVTLGVINSVGGIASTLTLGIVKNPIDAGVEAVIKIAKLVVATDKIISAGQYTKYPGLKWSLGVGGSLTGFATAVVILGAFNSGGGLVQKLTLGLVKNPIDAGVDAVTKVAKLIVSVDKIISSGQYTKYPGLKWSLGISSGLTTFATSVVILGALNSGGGLVQKLTLGLVKNPIDAGVDAVTKVSKLMVSVDQILSKGSFTKGPGLKWALGVGTVLSIFTTSMIALGALSGSVGILSKLVGAKNPIDSGTEALKKIAKSIVDVDKILSSGKYTAGPDAKWSKGISLALGAFSPIYTLLMKEKIMNIFGMGVSAKQYAEAIKMISQSIVDAANLFGKSNTSFKNGPPVQWATGISMALGAFSPIYTILLKNSGWFKSGVSPKQYAEAIKTISQGITDAANFFGNAKASFQNGPPVAWADGVSKALSAFFPIYEILLKNSGWFKSGVSPKQYAEAIKTISQGITDSANFFGNAKASFQNGPPVAWADGVSKALGAFSPIYVILLKNSGWFKSGVSPKQYAEAIKTIAQGIVDAANLFGKAKASFQNGPPVAWADGVGKALGAFSPIYTLLLKNSGWFKSGVSPKQFADAIKTMSQGIVDAANIFSKAKVAFLNPPPIKWADGVGKALGVFSPIYTLLLKNSGWFKSGVSPKQFADAIKTISQGIVDAANVFSKNKASFANYPSLKWSEGVSKALQAFAPIFEYLNKKKSFLGSLFGSDPTKDMTNAVVSIATALVKVSVILGKGNFSQSISENFVKGLESAYNLMFRLYPTVKDIKIDKFEKNLLKIAESFRNISSKLSGINYKNVITDTFIKGIDSAIDLVIRGIEKTKKFKIEDTFKLFMVANSITELATKLGKADFKKFPTDKWINGVYKTIDKFSQILSKLSKSSASITSGWMSTLFVISSISKVDSEFTKGKFIKFPSDKWINGITNTITKYSKLLSTVGKSLVSNLIGIFSLNLINKSILKTDLELSKGKFIKFPSDKWINGVTNSVTKYSKLLSTVGKSVVSNTIGLVSLNLINKSILKTDSELSKGKFTKFPSDKWINGVTNSVTKYSKLLSTVGKSLVSNLIGNLSLNKLISSMIEVDIKFSKGKFTNYPSDKWLNSLVNSVKKYTQLLSLVGKNILSNLLGRFSLNKLIDSILEVDIKFSKGKFIKYPSDKWLSNINKSIQSFINLFANINKNLSVSGLIQGLLKVRMVVDSILWIDKKLSTGKYQKWPIDSWIKKTTSSIMSYGKLIIDTDRKYALKGILSGILKDKMIVEFILWIDKTLSKGRYNKWPDKPWIPKTIESILKYGDLAIQSDKRFSWRNLISGISKIKLVTNTILWVDSVIGKGKYNKWPEKIWIDKTSFSVLKFGQLAIDVDKKFGIAKLFLGLKKTKMIADNIRDISLSLDKGKYTKFPGLQWAMAVPRAIAGFMNFQFKGVVGQMIDKLFGPSEDEKKSQLAKIVDLMLFVDRKFQSGNWQKFPTVNWVNGTILALQKFKNIVSLLSFSSIGDKVSSFFGNRNPLVAAMSNIEKLAICFDKLAKSVKTFQDSIKDLDAEKLASIKSLSSNVILLSLMDPAQFDSMMEKLEERAGVFGDLIKDFESQKKEESGDKKGGQVSVTTGKKAATKDNTNQLLLQKLDTMNALLADISSVVGSRGALKTYLSKIKEDVNLGSGNLTARSDKRIKNIIRKIDTSDSGINVYLFTYKFDPVTVYQGVMAQELLGTEFENAVIIDKNGYYSVDYSLIDVEFKKTKV
jgi:hypothetical protein